jgi:hypothetical protein
MTEDGVRIPGEIGEIDATWATEALGCRYPGTVVTSLHQGTIIHGSGTKIRLLLDYNDAGHGHRLPPTMWIKTGYEPHSDMIRNSYVGEKKFYRDINRDGFVNAPYCYFGGTDATGLTAVLLEDLLARNARFGIATAPLDVGAARRVLDMMARLHAEWWDDPRLAELGAVGGSFATDDIIFALIDGQDWEASVAEPRGANVPARFHSREAIRSAYSRLWEIDRTTTSCMLHGDSHLGNLFFEPDGTPGWFDWQRVMQGDWGWDVAYFLIGALEQDVCAEHEKSLLRYYLERREAYGVPEMAFDEAWLSYRRHALHGLVWIINPTTMQPVEINTAYALRFGAAVDRLECWAALFDQPERVM